MPMHNHMHRSEDRSEDRSKNRSMQRPVRRLALALMALCLAAGPAAAQADWPSKPVRFIIPFPPGSFADLTIRILQQKLGPRLGRPIIVDNRSGASGDIGSEALA